MSLFINGHQLLRFERYLNENDDMNQLTKTGIYMTTNMTPQNSPSDYNDGRWGTIVVINHDDGQIIQFWLIQSRIYQRWITTLGPQTGWQELVFMSEFDALKSRVDRLSDKIGGGI